MIKEAIKKINGEIQQKPEDRYRAAVGEYILDRITTEEIARKVTERTLESAMSEITAKAREAAQKGVAVIEDTEVFAWAMEVYGINPQAPAEKKKKEISVSLENFF